MKRIFNIASSIFWMACSVIITLLAIYGGYKGYKEYKTITAEDNAKTLAIGYFEELTGYGLDCAIEQILIEKINTMPGQFAQLESLIIEWDESYGVNDEIISKLIGVMLDSYEGIMTYPFEKLEDLYIFYSESSSDNKLRAFTWNLGWNRNFGYNYKLFIDDKYCNSIDLLYLLNYDDRYDYRYDDVDEISDIEIFTINLDNTTYYMLQIHYATAIPGVSYASVAIFTIEDNYLELQNIFETTYNGNPMLISEIEIDYCWDDEGEGRTWLFDYNHDTNTIYVPIVGEDDDSRYNLTNKYLLYKWNGTHFKYAGKDLHWTKK